MNYSRNSLFKMFLTAPAYFIHAQFEWLIVNFTVHAIEIMYIYELKFAMTIVESCHDCKRCMAGDRVVLFWRQDRPGTGRPGRAKFRKLYAIAG